MMVYEYIRIIASYSPLDIKYFVIIHTKLCCWLDVVIMNIIYFLVIQVYSMTVRQVEIVVQKSILWQTRSLFYIAPVPVVET